MTAPSDLKTEKPSIFEPSEKTHEVYENPASLRVTLIDMSEVTRILNAIDDGDPQASEKLLPLVYEELRKLAAHKMAQEAPDHTLQATALVHEAYLRLVGSGKPQHWDGRGHFFSAAAKAMRRILVDKARHKDSLKKGGARVRQEFDPEQPAATEIDGDILAIHEALDKLAEKDASAARLVELRYFAGFKLKDAAGMLNISERSADRLWAYARAWLHKEISRE